MHQLILYMIYRFYLFICNFFCTQLNLIVNCSNRPDLRDNIPACSKYLQSFKKRYKSIEEFYKQDQLCYVSSKTKITATNDASIKENIKKNLSVTRSGEHLNTNSNDEYGMELDVTESKLDIVGESHISLIEKTINKYCQNNIQFSIENSNHTIKTEEEIKNKNDHIKKQIDTYLKIRKTTRETQKEHVSKKLPHCSIINRSDQIMTLKRCIKLGAGKRDNDKQSKKYHFSKIHRIE